MVDPARERRLMGPGRPGSGICFCAEKLFFNVRRSTGAAVPDAVFPVDCQAVDLNKEFGGVMRLGLTTAFVVVWRFAGLNQS
jgi:hypothetical protein